MASWNRAQGIAMKRNRIGHAKDAAARAGFLLDEIAHLLHLSQGGDASDYF